MYTRGPSIASIFQKAALLKDTKSNKIIHRQLCSESLIKFSKIEKLKPMKRYFSTASNNRNPNQKNRTIQGVGYIRRALPKFPREITQPMPMNAQITTCYIQNKQGVASNDLRMPLNGQITENAQCGKITIVLDKSEICGCSAPDANVQIHVTTKPEVAIRPMQVDASYIGATKCNCCPQCRDGNCGMQNMLPRRPTAPPSQQPNRMIVFSNRFPEHQQYVNGLQQHGPRNFNVFDGATPLHLAKSRSMSDVPAMRKFIIPIDETQPRARQLNGPPITRTNSLNRTNTFGRVDSIHPVTLQQPMGPQRIQMQRSFSVHSPPITRTNSVNRANTFGRFDNIHSVTLQQPMGPQRMQRSFSLRSQDNQPGASKVNPLPGPDIVIPNPKQDTKFHPTDIFKKDLDAAKRIEKLKNIDRKYSSIHPNGPPTVLPDNGCAVGNVRNGGPKLDQPKSKFIVERVIRPAQFSSAGRVISKNTGSIAAALNEIAVTQKIKSLPGPSTKVKASNVPFVGKPNLLSLHHAVVTKNRFPAERMTAPRNRFLYRSGSDARADNVSKVISRFGQTITPSVTHPMGNAGQTGALTRNKYPFQSLSITPKQRSTESINRKQFSVYRQPQFFVPNSRFDTQRSFNQIVKRQPPNVSYRQRSNVPVQVSRQAAMKTNLVNQMGRTKQPPAFLLKRPAPMRSSQVNRMGQTKQPPLFVMKKRAPMMLAFGRKKRQPLQRPAFVPPLQQRLLQPKISSKQYKPQGDRVQFLRTRPSHMSMIPVRSRVPPQSTAPLRRVPVQPIKRQTIRKQQNPKEPQNPNQSPVGRVRRGQVPTPLPAVVSKTTNQIEKFSEKPKSVVTADRPVGRIRNPLRLQMPPRSDKRESTTSQKSPEMAPPPVDTSRLRVKNPAVLFYAPGKLELVEIPMPRLTDDKDVIVKMLYVHLTDTDAQMLSAEQDGPYKLNQPTIAGKSGSGVIVDAGKKVDNVKIGDKVSVKGLSCGKCAACQNDNEVMCEKIPMTEKLGILKRFHAVPAKFVTKLPDSVHPIDGAMIDELSSAIRACKKSTVTAGDNVLVLGGRSLGLWTALAAKSMGATNVCLADARPQMLDQAKSLGIERLFLIDPKSPIPIIVDGISKYLEKDNPRIVFDCNGSSLTNYIAMNTSAVGGKVVFMKNAVSNQPMFLMNAVDRGIDLLSSQHGNNESERAALQFLSTGKVQLKGIESSFFKITNVREAFGLINSGATTNIFIQPSRPDYESEGKK